MEFGQKRRLADKLFAEWHTPCQVTRIPTKAKFTQYTHTHNVSTRETFEKKKRYATPLPIIETLEWIFTIENVPESWPWAIRLSCTYTHTQLCWPRFKYKWYNEEASKHDCSPLQSRQQTGPKCLHAAKDSTCMPKGPSDYGNSILLYSQHELSRFTPFQL